DRGPDCGRRRWRCAVSSHVPEGVAVMTEVRLQGFGPVGPVEPPEEPVQFLTPLWEQEAFRQPACGPAWRDGRNEEPGGEHELHQPGDVEAAPSCPRAVARQSPRAISGKRMEVRLEPRGDEPVREVGYRENAPVRALAVEICG